MNITNVLSNVIMETKGVENIDGKIYYKTKPSQTTESEVC
jgi:hypothetical protein